MSVQMLIRIEPDLKEKLKRLSRSQGKTTSQMIRNILEDYVNERDIGAYIDDLWNRIGKKLKSKKIEEKDIKQAIKEVRKKKNESRH